MDYKKWQRNIPVCLECGDKIRYGRTDKKFCCDECRNRHYNSKLKEGRAYRRKVLAILQKNYDLLDELLKSGVDSADSLPPQADSRSNSAMESAMIFFIGYLRVSVVVGCLLRRGSA